MGWDFFDSKKVKTRKVHKCQLCNRLIPKGTENVEYWGGMFDGEFQHSYVCWWCYEHLDNFTDDEMLADFWDTLRDSIFYDEFKQYKGVLCEGCRDGSYEIELQGDWLVAVCSDCRVEVWTYYMPVVKEEQL
jgi:hypothetical protein